MSNDFPAAEPGMDVPALRDVGAGYLRDAAGHAGVPFTAGWGWEQARMWVPDGDRAVAADQALALLGPVEEGVVVPVEVLWRAPGTEVAAWWRAGIASMGFGAGVAWLRGGEFADPRTEMIDLADVAAVLPLPEGAPASCLLGAGREDFMSSPLRAVPDLGELVPRAEMTVREAEVLGRYWVHWTSHRVGTLYPVNLEQASACQERLFDLAVDAVARGPQTRIDAVAYAYELTIDRGHHDLGPLPEYARGSGAAVAGTRMLAHPHPCGRVGVNDGDLEQLAMVLSVVARYGGVLHLITKDPARAGDPPIAKTQYVVHWDMRAELVEDERAREISLLNRLTAT